MGRVFRFCLIAFLLAWSGVARADVAVTFHSFNGSILAGRYPHTFVSLEGSLDDGTKISENYGFSAKRATPAVLRGPVEHIVMTEEEKWLRKTNRHFTITVDDEEYWQLRKEVARWRDAPGKYYDLDKRNCIHFVGAIAKMIGVSVNFPEKMLRRPKAWLNHIVAKNPHLKGRQF